MNIIFGSLCIAALVLAWAERAASARLLKMSREYWDEGNKSWDRGEACFRKAIERTQETEAMLMRNIAKLEEEGR
jgi:hypothetical protein